MYTAQRGTDCLCLSLSLLHQGACGFLGLLQRKMAHTFLQHHSSFFLLHWKSLSSSGVTVLTGRRVCRPERGWAPCGCSAQPGRQAYGRTGMARVHEWCPEKQREKEKIKMRRQLSKSNKRRRSIGFNNLQLQELLQSTKAFYFDIECPKSTIIQLSVYIFSIGTAIYEHEFSNGKTATCLIFS